MYCRKGPLVCINITGGEVRGLLNHLCVCSIDSIYAVHMWRGKAIGCVCVVCLSSQKIGISCNLQG